jgi:hypothetical protein
MSSGSWCFRAGKVAERSGARAASKLRESGDRLLQCVRVSARERVRKGSCALRRVFINGSLLGQGHTVFGTLQSAMPNSLCKNTRDGNRGGASRPSLSLLKDSRLSGVLAKKRTACQHAAGSHVRDGSPPSNPHWPGRAERIGRMMRGTRSRCGRLRHGWARPAQRVPAQRSPPPPNHIVPSPPLFGTECVSWHQSRLPGRLNVWALGDSASLLRKSIGAQRYLTIIPSLCASCAACASSVHRAHFAIDFPRLDGIQHGACDDSHMVGCVLWFCGVVGGFCDGGADPSRCEVLLAIHPLDCPCI